MKLGAFSISLAVKDIHASKAFYETLGFAETGGNIDQGWLVLRLGDKVIGLFQGMFEKNMLTFNPGWDSEGNTVAGFTDVRDIQKALKARGIEPTSEADDGASGPGSCMIVDPDGNPILIDQHI